MRNIYVKLFSLVLFCVAVPFFVNAYEFTKDLKVGDSNNDVKELQKILNEDSSTAVTSSGFGSKGNETIYFGNLTKQAVVRFQEKYKNEILLPNGLNFGTGFVGKATRAKLSSSSVVPVKAGVQDSNSLAKESAKKNVTTSFFNDINPSEISKVGTFFGSVMSKMSGQTGSMQGSSLLDSETINSIPFLTKTVKIYSVSPYQVKPGQKVVVSGTGFAQNNNFFSFGNRKTEGLACQYSTYCEVVVPNNTSLGEQNVTLENSNGNTSNQGFSAKVFVTNTPVKEPVVASATPKEIKESSMGEKVTVTGESFSSNENYIYTPLGQSGPYSSSDQKTLSFSLKEMPDIDKLIKRAKLLNMDIVPVPFILSNQNGSSEAYFVNLLINK